MAARNYADGAGDYRAVVLSGIATVEASVTEREEFEKWWKDERNYVRSDIELGFAAFQAGRRSRQKQDAELIGDETCDQTEYQCSAIERCATKIEEAP